MKKEKIGINFNPSKDELNYQKKFSELKKKIGSKTLNQRTFNGTFLFASRQAITRLLYYNEIYKLILNKPGVIYEFGVEYGATLSLLAKFRGIYEPYNRTRKIVGFDTFSGFTSKFHKSERIWKKGYYSVPKNYEKILEKLLELEEKNSPLSHIKKFELVKGDASITFPKYLKKNPHSLVSLAIFDMDLYHPTKAVLKKLMPRLSKGSVLVFDELNSQAFPGETQALLETLNINKLKLRNFHGVSWSSYCVIGD